MKRSCFVIFLICIIRAFSLILQLLFITCNSYRGPAILETIAFGFLLSEPSPGLDLRNLASEADLELYESDGVRNLGDTCHKPSFCSIGTAQERFNLGQGIVFDNHVTALSNRAKEVQQIPQ
jgi:hypothetical protein